jgi:hypothetical protein
VSAVNKDGLPQGGAALLRAARLSRLLDLVIRTTAQHLDAGNWARVEVLDARFLVVEDASMDAQDLLTAVEYDQFGQWRFGPDAWATRPLSAVQ